MAMTGGTAKLVKTGAIEDSNASVKLYVYYKTSQNVEKNQSTVYCGMYVVVSDGYYIGSWSDSGSYIGKSSITFSGAVPGGTKGTYWLVENKSFTVNHSADGKGTAKIYWKWGVNSSWANMEYPSGSFTITLPTIPRKSSVSATNAYIGNKPTITITSASSSFTHTLQYKIAGQSDYTTIVSKTTSKSYSSWAIPEKAYNYITDGKVTVTIRCITYSGSTNIGNTTTTLTASQKGASSITATSGYIGNFSAITVNSYSSSFKHTLQYKIAGQSDYTTIETKASGTNFATVIPEEAYNYISSTAKSVKITVRCITYYGDVNLGNKTTTYTASCSESACKPTLAPTVKDTGSVSAVLSGDANNIVIKDYNVMSYTIGATAKNGATIKSQKITCGGKSATAASGKLSYVNSNKFVFTATDSRGFSNSTTITKKTLINYLAVSCAMKVNAVLESDNTATLTITGSGKFFNGSFGAVTNSITVQYRYKVNSGEYSAWTTMTATKSGNTYTATKKITGLNYKDSFRAQVRAYDEIYKKNETTSAPGYAITDAKTVKAQPVFDWGQNDFSFHANVVLDNNTRLYGRKADGSAWVQALEPCNANNNLTLGFGGYDASLGNTNVYGNSVNVNSKNNINLNSPVKLIKDTYSSACAMDCQNSDIWGVNGIIFADKCNGASEGIKFPTDDSSGTYDRLAAFDGNLYFYPKDSTTGYALFYTAGNKLTLSGLIAFSGYITNGSTEIYAFIPTSRRILASNVTASGKIVARGGSGYVYNPTDTDNYYLNLGSPSGFTVTTAVKEMGIYLKLVFSSKILNGNGNTYTNNSPVTLVNSGDVVFTFS